MGREVQLRRLGGWFRGGASEGLSTVDGSRGSVGSVESGGRAIDIPATSLLLAFSLAFIQCYSPFVGEAQQNNRCYLGESPHLSRHKVLRSVLNGKILKH